MQEALSYHDLRYLRDDEIPLSNKMRALSRMHIWDDFVTYLEKQDIEQDMKTVLPSLCEDYLQVFSPYFSEPIKYKIQPLSENETLILYLTQKGRRLFSAHLSW